MTYASYRDLETKVLIWGDARGITKHGTALGQAKKVREEALELYDAIVHGDIPAAKDAIGDTLVTLIMVAAKLDVDVVQCLALAYDEIKDRKGRMGPDGIFHKE
jgi:phosphoribosyl-ATP pyrophosphohydrolase